MKPLILGSCLIITCILISGFRNFQKYLQAKGIFLGREVELKVDSYLAKLLIENRSDPDKLKFEEIYNNKPLTNKLLLEISKRHSSDVAAIYALNRLYQLSENHIAQNKYNDIIKALENDLMVPELKLLKEKYFLFVPGLGYKEDSTTGADFAKQRKLLDSLKIPNRLIETNEWGFVEENSLIIADSIRKASGKYPDIVLVSASKGGLETAIVLGKIMKPDELKNVSAWVSVGGILRGTAIADQYLSAPKCWLAELLLRRRGKNISIVKDMSHKLRAPQFLSLSFPNHIKVFHYVGAPLKSQIQKRIKGRYRYLHSRFGPNDGLTSIMDEITPGGTVISEIGLDHYFIDKNIAIKTLALACLTLSKK
ncbi:MAG: hypothetical protein HZB42_02930 [Sphingobacteriales bacterium]|nr:hypothetical protein [Sphingobacteriales bacterium]